MWNPVFDFSIPVRWLWNFLCAYRFSRAVLNGSKKQSDTGKTVNDILNSGYTRTQLCSSQSSALLWIWSSCTSWEHLDGASICLLSNSVTSLHDGELLLLARAVVDDDGRIMRWETESWYRGDGQCADILLKHCQQRPINWRENEIHIAVLAHDCATALSSNKLTLGTASWVLVEPWAVGLRIKLLGRADTCKMHCRWSLHLEDRFGLRLLIWRFLYWSWSLLRPQLLQLISLFCPSRKNNHTICRKLQRRNMFKGTLRQGLFTRWKMKNVHQLFVNWGPHRNSWFLDLSYTQMFNVQLEPVYYRVLHFSLSLPWGRNFCHC